MNRKMRVALLLAALAASLLPVTPAFAQPDSPYFRAVTNLAPAAYWPLQETLQPPIADVETNLGSLGPVANAYYSSVNVTKGVGGATGDGDTSVQFTGGNGSFLAVPTRDSRCSVPAGPFTVEAWVLPNNANNDITIIAQTGPAGSGGVNGGANSAGWSLNQNYFPSSGGFLVGWSFHVYNGVGTGGAEAVALYNYTAFTWYHLVGVFDGSRAYLYVNGALVDSRSTSAPISGAYVPDTWDPLTIGCGRGLNNKRFTGQIDEVAIYTKVLTQAQIQNHFNNAGGTSYSTIVSTDAPYMYWRLDAPAYVGPDPSAYPVAANYGALGNVNGLYLSGTLPGAAGPAFDGFGASSYACAFNGIGTAAATSIPLYSNGVPTASYPASSGVIIPNIDPAFNLPAHSRSLAYWFKANPADNRWNAMFCNGDKAWRSSLDSSGSRLRFNPGEGGEITYDQTKFRFNDGQWHFLACVYTNTGIPAGTSGMYATNYLYLDGMLVGSASVTSTNPVLGTNVAIGVAAGFDSGGNGNVYNQRHFAGSLAHVAYFTNALSASDIVSLYSNAIPNRAPVIYSQPYPYPAIRTVQGGAGVYIYEGVNAVGTPPLTYQWYYNSVSNYAGATPMVDNGVKYVGSTTLNVTITNLVDSDSGYYFAVVSNNYGAVTTAVVNVQVHAAPFITAQNPAGPFSLFVGQSSRLSVTVTAAANTNLTYQWFTNGVADTTGTNATYPLTSVQLDQSGETFQCVVTNVYGSATSLLSTLTVQSPPPFLTSSPFASSTLALSPTAYYPMHEVAPPAPADIETNYGTLGALGTAYYADWNLNNGNPGNTAMTHGIPGALANDSDAAVQFNNQANSYLLVPHTSPRTTLTPPLSIECWVASPVTTFGDIISQSGTRLNGGNANNAYGIRLSWGGNIQTYGTAAGVSSAQLALNQWHHVVYTYDGTNVILYVDGYSVATSVQTGFLADSWDPLTIGAGLWNNGGVTRKTSIFIDEVAIYTNVLDSTAVSTHYTLGTSGSAGQYVANVTSLNPLLYYRMNSSTFTVPPNGTWPVMTNYGTAAVNGTYQPGLAAGSVPGPNSGFGGSRLSDANSAPMNGLSTFASASTSDATVFCPPTKTSPLSFSLWFKGNPSDSRYQTLVSQGTGWQLAVQQNGTLQFYLGSTYLNSTRVYNDGYWHHVVVTYSTNVGNIYVDGLLDATGTSVSLTNPVPSTANALGIGCDTRYIRPTDASGAGRQYAGNICEMAFWNGTALDAGQIQALYSSAGAPPLITTQPLSTTNNAGVNYTNSMFALGAFPLSYQWYQNGSPVPGQTTSSLTYTPLAGANAGDYYVVVTNAYGAVTSSVVTVIVYTAPLFTLQPPPACTVFAGASPSFTVATKGAAPIGYYWLSNGVPIDFATGATYVVTDAQVNATYACVATNYLGQTTSSAVSLTVIPRPTASYPVAVLYDNPIGYWRLTEPNNGSGNTGAQAYDYLGGHNGTYLNTILAQEGYSQGLATQFGYSPALDPAITSAQFGYYPVNPGASNLVTGISGIDFATPTNTSGAFSIEAWAKGDAVQTYNAGIVAKGAWAAEQFTLDNGGTDHSYRFTMRDSGTRPLYVSANTNTPDGNWHHLVGVLDQANSNACLYVDGVKVASLACSPSNGVLSTAVPISIGARLGGGGLYNQQFFGNVNDVAIYNYALTADQVLNHYIAAGVGPRITQQPVASTNLDENTTLAVPAAAVGSLPLSYQWYDTAPGGSPTPIPGQTSPTLVIPSISALAYDQHTFTLVVTNAYGQTTSSGVTVGILSGVPFNLAIMPSTLSVYAGQHVVFSVTAQGTEPFSYQWSVDSVPVPGANSVTYTNIAQAGVHSIGCTVANIHGPTSASASLIVAALPTDNYGVGILGDQPVAYWRLDEAVGGSTAFDYSGSHNGSYYNAVNSLPGFTPSDTAAGFGMNGFTSYSMALETDSRASGTQPIDFSQQGNNAQFSVEAWVKIPFPQLGGAGIVTKGYGNGGEQFNLDVYGNAFRWRVRTAATNSYGPSATFPVDGNWHHVVGVCDQANGALNLYVDGSLNATSSIPVGAGVLPPLPDPYGNPVLTSIGARMQNQNDTPYSFQLTNSVVDDVAIYNYALTPDRVFAHYTAAQMPPQFVVDLNPQCYAYAGFPLSLSVLASGNPPLAYQWQRNGLNLTDGGPITGSRTDTLTVNPVRLSDSGEIYRVIVTNPVTHASVVSAASTLTVLPRLQFNGLGDGWSDNGYATFTSANVLRLTDGGKSEASSSFFGYPVYIHDFQATFTYQDVGGGGADGAAFVIHNDARGAAALGGAGGGLGYNGITNSAALEFNIFSSNGVGFAVRTNGITGTPYASASPVNLAGGNPINVSLRYVGGLLSMTLIDTVNGNTFSTNTVVDIPAAVGANTAYVGITGADGNTTSTQTVTNFSFVSLVGLYIQPTPDNQVVISWPEATGGYMLQQSSSLGSGWSNVATSPSLNGGFYQVVLPASDASAFYRLINNP